MLRQRVECLGDLRDEGHLVLVEHLERPPDRALPEPQGVPQQVRPRRPSRVPDRGDDRPDLRRPGGGAAAGAGSGSGSSAGAAAGAWLTIRKTRARRRFLDDLQERVGAGGRQVLGAVDDADAIAATGRGRAEDPEGAAHRVDRDRGRGPLLVGGRRPPEHGEVRMRQSRDLAGGGGAGGSTSSVSTGAPGGRSRSRRAAR